MKANLLKSVVLISIFSSVAFADVRPIFDREEFSKTGFYQFWTLLTAADEDNNMSACFKDADYYIRQKELGITDVNCRLVGDGFVLTIKK